MADPTRC